MLTDAQCRNAVCSPTSKRERLSDSGGLYLEVAPGGSRRWFWKYRHEGKEGRMALGSPPSTRARIISGPFFLPEISAPRGVPAIGAVGGCQPKRWKSATFSARAVSVLCLACG